MNFGILLQGRITKWTPSIIDEYTKNFPDAEILVSTWNDENVEDIKCKINHLNMKLFVMRVWATMKISILIETGMERYHRAE